MSLQKRLGTHSHVETRTFWFLLAVIIALPLIALVNSEFSTLSLSGSATIQNIAYVKAGAQFDINVRENPGEVIGVEWITLLLKEDIKNGQVLVQADNTIPFDRPYYSKFVMTSSDAPKIASVTFQLKVKERDLTNKGVSVGDVRLYHNGKELPTSFTQRKGDYVSFSATAPAPGKFVIGKVAPVQKEEVTTVMPTMETEPVTEEVPAEEVAEEPAIAGEAARTTAEARVGLWTRIVEFLRNLFE